MPTVWKIMNKIIALWSVMSLLQTKNNPKTTKTKKQTHTHTHQKICGHE